MAYACQRCNIRAATVLVRPRVGRASAGTSRARQRVAHRRPFGPGHGDRGAGGGGRLDQVPLPPRVQAVRRQARAAANLRQGGLVFETGRGDGHAVRRRRRPRVPESAGRAGRGGGDLRVAGRRQPVVLLQLVHGRVHVGAAGVDGFRRRPRGNRPPGRVESAAAGRGYSADALSLAPLSTEISTRPPAAMLRPVGGISVRAPLSTEYPRGTALEGPP